MYIAILVLDLEVGADFFSPCCRDRDPAYVNTVRFQNMRMGISFGSTISINREVTRPCSSVNYWCPTY